MKSNEKFDQLEEIYNSFIDGQRKQMVSQIKEYGEDFWDDLDSYMKEWTPVLKYRTLFDIVSYYTKFGG